MDFAGTMEFVNGELINVVECNYLEHRYNQEGFESLYSEFDCMEYTFDDALIRIKESNIRLNKDELKKLKELLDGNQ